MSDIQGFEDHERGRDRQAWRENEARGEENAERKNVLSFLKEFSDYTSAHGLGRIHGSKKLLGKVIWSLFFIGAVSMLIFQVHLLFTKYQARPLNTFIRLEHDTSLPFPTVTFCNFNSIRKSRSENMSALLHNSIKELYQQLDDHQNSNKYQKERRAIDENTSPDDYGSGDMGDDNGEFFDEDIFEDPSQFTKGYAVEVKMLIALAYLPLSDLKRLGHQFDEMVISCTYRGISCGNFTKKFWTSYWHYNYGNCYVFNSGEAMLNRSEKNLKSNKAGPSHGLNLELNIEQSEYIGNKTEEAGVRVDISDAGEMPFPLEQGISVAPGFATSIGITKAHIQRKDPFDNGRCRKPTAMEEEENLYHLEYNASYSAMACKESCLAYNQRKQCGCMEYRFPPVDPPRVCYVLNKTEAKCLSKVQRDFKANKFNCSKRCRSPCEQNVFKRSVSVASWPAEEREIFLTDNYNYSQSLRSDVLKIEIFYEDLNYEVIEETFAYELVNFVSDVGGQLGLWIGFSVLTICEFLELMLLICREIIKRCIKTGKVHSSSADPINDVERGLSSEHALGMGMK